MALEWILHARYMTPAVLRGTNNYGGQDTGSPCFQTEKQEAPFTSNTADVSRNTFNYFASGPIYLAGAPSGLGGMDGTVETGNGNKQAVNRAVNFMQKDYVLIGDRIYVYNDGTGQWNSEITLTGKTATSTSSLGLYPVFINNIPHLITAWSVSNGTNWRFAKLNGDTGTWTISPSLPGGLAINDTNGGVLTEIQHKNRIYYLTSSETSIGYFQFDSELFGTIPINTTSRHPMDFASYMGNLYLLNKNNADSVQVLKVEVGGTSFELNFDTGTPSEIVGIDIGDALTQTSQFEGRPLFFVDNVYDSGNPTLWAYYVSHAFSAGHNFNGTDSTTDTNHGLRAVPLKLNGNGDLVQYSGPGVPVNGFRANPFKMMQNQEGAGGGFSRKDEDMVLRYFVDQKERGQDGSGKSSIVCASRFAGQGGGNILVVFPCPGNPGGGGDFNNLMYHSFKGSGNALGGDHPDPPTKDGGPHAFEFLGFPAKATRHRAFPHGQLGGGARHSEIDANGNRIADIVFRGTDSTGQNGVIRIFYSIIPSVANPSGDNVNVRWWFDKDNHAPETPCTLVGTSEGSISGLLATNIIVDPNKTYWVDWQAKGDGLQRLKTYTLNGQINLNEIPVGAISDPSGLNGLVSWFEADDDSTVVSGVNGEVQEWTDKAGGVSGVGQPTLSNRPTLVVGANNGLDGIQFDSANSEYLFASGSPITGESSTVFVVYEPTGAAANETIVSLSSDAEVSGNYSHEYWNVERASDDTLRLADQDTNRVLYDLLPERNLSIPSGGEANKARLAVWTNTAFESIGRIEPSGTTQETSFTVDGSVEATGLANTTFGRFSGAQLSGVYNDAGQYYNGFVYEIVVYNRILSDAEIDRFRLYIEAKYALDV